MTRSRGEVQTRLAVCREFIKILEDTSDRDERKEEALAYYKNQECNLQQELDAIEIPAPTVIGLKTARLFSKPGGNNG